MEILQVLIDIWINSIANMNLHEKWENTNDRVVQGPKSGQKDWVSSPQSV